MAQRVALNARTIAENTENGPIMGPGKAVAKPTRRGLQALNTNTQTTFGGVRPANNQNNDPRMNKKVVSKKRIPLNVVDENAGVQASSKSAVAGDLKSKWVVGSKIPLPLTRAESMKDIGFSSLALPVSVEDIDAADANNVFLSPEYVNDIYAYLRQLEKSQALRANFLSIQREMTPKMRSVLVDWLINVHHQFKLLPETLYMGIAIMDRFFQCESVTKDKIQLVGVTAFFIASKFEEIYPPDLIDFVSICDQLYSKREIIKMEMIVLRTLKFELGRPLPLHFLRRNSKAAHADPKIHTMAKYLMEITLLDHECSHWDPSLLAAVSLYVTLKVLGEGTGSKWNETIAHYSNYSESQLLPHAAHLCKLIRKSENSKYQNCRKKYSSPKLYQISKSTELASMVIDELAAST
jgi:cyclin B